MKLKNMALVLWFVTSMHGALFGDYQSRERFLQKAICFGYDAFLTASAFQLNSSTSLDWKRKIAMVAPLVIESGELTGQLKNELTNDKNESGKQGKKATQGVYKKRLLGALYTFNAVHSAKMLHNRMNLLRNHENARFWNYGLDGTLMGGRALRHANRAYYYLFDLIRGNYDE